MVMCRALEVYINVYRHVPAYRLTESLEIDRKRQWPRTVSRSL